MWFTHKSSTAGSARSTYVNRRMQRHSISFINQSAIWLLICKLEKTKPSIFVRDTYWQAAVFTSTLYSSYAGGWLCVMPCCWAAQCFLSLSVQPHIVYLFWKSHMQWRSTHLAHTHSHYLISETLRPSSACIWNTHKTKSLRLLSVAHHSRLENFTACLSRKSVFM